MGSPTIPRKLIFLPGARGDASFWRPVSDCLVEFEGKELLGWPWFGSPATGAGPANFEELAAWVAGRIDQPCALIAQSMGGVIALLATLMRPESVTHLVLTVTSGGIQTDDLGIADWRPAFFAANTRVPRWIAERIDLSDTLQLIHQPTLLVWGDSDAISPVGVGRRLQSRITQAKLHVIEGGDHDLAVTHAVDVASLIARHVNGGA